MWFLVWQSDMAPSLTKKTECLNHGRVTIEQSYLTSNKCRVWPHRSLPVAQKLAANLSCAIAVSLHALMTSQTCLLIVQVLQVLKKNIWKLKIGWDRKRIFDLGQTLVFSLVAAVTVRIITYCGSAVVLNEGEFSTRRGIWELQGEIFILHSKISKHGFIM